MISQSVAKRVHELVGEGFGMPVAALESLEGPTVELLGLAPKNTLELPENTLVITQFDRVLGSGEAEEVWWAAFPPNSPVRISLWLRLTGTRWITAVPVAEVLACKPDTMETRAAMTHLLGRESVVVGVGRLAVAGEDDNADVYLLRELLNPLVLLRFLVKAMRNR